MKPRLDRSIARAEVSEAACIARVRAPDEAHGHYLIQTDELRSLVRAWAYLRLEHPAIPWPRVEEVENARKTLDPVIEWSRGVSPIRTMRDFFGDG